MIKNKRFIFALILNIFFFSAFSQASINLVNKAKESGFTLYWDSLSQAGLLEKNGHQLSFSLDKEIIVLDSVLLKISDAPQLKDNQLYVTQKFYDDAAAFLNQKSENPFKVGAILIDAGHGGKDPGAVGPRGTREKDINLSIALQLEKVFKKDKNYKVILTRDDDTFVELVERANIANQNKADLFISVHCNANLNRNASGFEVYFLSENASNKASFSAAILENSVIELEDKNDTKKTALQNMLWSMVVNEYINESSELASFVSQESTGRLKIPNRGVKQDVFYVLRGTQMPAILVETAYISNYTEESKLNTSSFQKAIADSIYEGVKKYYARKAKETKK